MGRMLETLPRLGKHDANLGNTTWTWGTGADLKKHDAILKNTARIRGTQGRLWKNGALCLPRPPRVFQVPIVFSWFALCYPIPHHVSQSTRRVYQVCFVYPKSTPCFSSSYLVSQVCPMFPSPHHVLIKPALCSPSPHCVSQDHTWSAKSAHVPHVRTEFRKSALYFPSAYCISQVCNVPPQSLCHVPQVWAVFSESALVFHVCIVFPKSVSCLLNLLHISQVRTIFPKSSPASLRTSKIRCKVEKHGADLRNVMQS